MYRVLILDDEPYIVDWIRDLVESIWDYELDIYSTYSSAEAINLLNRARIDVMISDICLPGLSGIDLLKQVKVNWPTCKVIMLTGYDDFNYAYESIQNKAYQYILKTEDDDKILKIIKQALADSEEEFKETQNRIATQKQVTDTLRLARQTFLADLVHREQTLDPINTFARFHVSLDPTSPCYVLVGHVHWINQYNSMTCQDHNLTDVQSIASQYLSSHYLCEVIRYDTSKLVWLIQPLAQSNTSKELNSAKIIGLMEQVQHCCSGKYHLTLSLIYSHKAVSINKLTHIVPILDQTLTEKTKDGTGFIRDYESCHMDMVSDVLVEDNAIGVLLKHDALFDRLNIFLHKGNKEGYFRILAEIGDALSDHKINQDSLALELYYRVALILLRYIHRQKLTNDITYNIGLHRLMHVGNMIHWGDQMAYLHTLSTRIFEKQMRDFGKKDLVRFVEDYIQNHISEDVSLIKLGEITKYNPSYLSRTYKESTGQTLMEYINRVRLKTVKEMMLRNDMSLNDIAMKAGFNSRQYFNRFVKKMVNATPDELRHIILSEN